MSKTLIITTLEQTGPLKATELVAKREIALLDNPIALIDECIQEGSIREIEYIVPQLPYRVKSFLVPKNSDLAVAKQKLLDQGFKLV